MSLYTVHFGGEYVDGEDKISAGGANSATINDFRSRPLPKRVAEQK